MWGPGAKGIGLRESGEIDFRVGGKETSFHQDIVMSYPQLIVWALEVRRRMGVSRLPEAVMRLKDIWDACPNTGVSFEDVAKAWKEQLSQTGGVAGC